jgi:hypothetical protein
MTETVTFLASAKPPLDDGTYTVSVTQNVALDHDPADPGEQFQSSITFAVQGPHFQLPPGMVFRVAPAQQAQGDFGLSLPSIALSDPTLPWQRTVETSNGTTPWLALLVFDQSDPPPVPVSGTVADLQNPEAGVFCPTPTLGLGESATDPITYIDIPAYLFNTIVPLAGDIGWLSHVETITDPGGANGAQPSQNGAAAPQTAAVLIANRFAVPGRETTVHLVSFEGWGTALVPMWQQVTMADGKSQYGRVVSLYHWSFGSNGTADSLTGMAAALSAGPLRRAGNVLMPTPTVDAALSLGYTPMNHTLRDGSATVSWYRGPLLPQPATAFPGQPASATNPDALLRYDPTTGLFDASYASAFTLGWLLALNNPSYTAAYYRWLDAIAQLQVQAVEAQALAATHQLATGVELNTGTADHVGAVISNLVANLAPKIGRNPS